MASISDMNLQHPELIPLLIATEPKLKENEWIEVRGLMSRVSTPPIGVILELRSYGRDICLHLGRVSVVAWLAALLL